MAEARIGVDIGGSGIKAALVNVEDGTLIGKRVRMATPDPSTPDAVAAATAEIVSGFGVPGPIGIGFPAVVKDGWVESASNIDKSWIDVNAIDLFENVLERTVWMINDADAAGLAELAFGAARDVSGTVIVLTFGTGIGSALLTDGELVPNLELGQLEFGGHYPAESHYSAKARKTDGLSWDEWGVRAADFIRHIDLVFSPARIVVGGGISRKWGNWAHHLDESLPVVPAALANNAGIVGAAALAANE